MVADVTLRALEVLVPRFRVDRDLGLESNIEKTIGVDLTDTDVLGQVMVVSHGDGTFGSIKQQIVGSRADLGGIESLSLFDGESPHVDINVSGFHGIVQERVVTETVLVVFDKGLGQVIGIGDGGALGKVGHEVVPRGKVTKQLFLSDIFDFGFRDGDGHDGVLVRAHTRVGHMREEFYARD